MPFILYSKVSRIKIKVCRWRHDTVNEIYEKVQWSSSKAESFYTRQIANVRMFQVLLAEKVRVL